jgi:hypothetical protein
MTKDDIIKMAQTAGWEMGNDLSDGFGERLQRFAEIAFNSGALAAMKAFDHAIVHERAECAQLVEQAGIDGYGTLAAAAMIRARGEK